MNFLSKQNGFRTFDDEVVGVKYCNLRSEINFIRKKYCLLRALIGHNDRSLPNLETYGVIGVPTLCTLNVWTVVHFECRICTYV